MLHLSSIGALGGLPHCGLHRPTAACHPEPSVPHGSLADHHPAAGHSHTPFLFIAVISPLTCCMTLETFLKLSEP